MVPYWGLICIVHSIQQTSREIRYNYFKKFILNENINYLFLGHHLNDQIETILMRLTRKSGLYGLQGIKDIVRFNTNQTLTNINTNPNPNHNSNPDNGKQFFSPNI